VDDAWLRALAAGYGGGGDVVTAESPSGALIATVGPIVIKVHHLRTDPTLLAARLRAAADARLADVLVPPVSTTVHPTPDGRSATVWPRMEVLHPCQNEAPWADAGTLLARLHRVDHEPIAMLPALRPIARLERALRRVPSAKPGAPLLLRVGSAILAQAVSPPPGARLVHGDWHLGQLGSRAGWAWRLLDIDDLGVGDPAWDLARPAGFWAAGLLPDCEWDAMLTAYRSAGGPGVPRFGDPWPRLDLPARAAVVVAACRAVTRPESVAEDTADALLEACGRM
jgi:hypothetical protein